MTVRMPNAKLWTIGVDEVGLGSLAGPLVVCALVAPAHWCPQVPVGDSKKMTPRQRAISAAGLRADRNIAFAFDIRSHEMIDEYGIRPVLKDATWSSVKAVKNAALIALGAVGASTARVVVDGDITYPGFESIPKADSTVREVGAASILAKEYRDELMRVLAEGYSGYGFEDHKGYGTPKHFAALKRLGPSDIHRKTFEPVKGMLAAHG